MGWKEEAGTPPTHAGISRQERVAVDRPLHAPRPRGDQSLGSDAISGELPRPPPTRGSVEGIAGFLRRRGTPPRPRGDQSLFE